ncbi:MAG: thiolase domain-containing protein [bacterium]
MSKVYVRGVGMTNFGELWDYDLRKLAFEAAVEALNDAQIKIKHIDAIFVANMASSRFTGQEHLGALVASELNTDCPAYRVEGACASGSLAINLAYHSILSGSFENVLVIGAEKMTDVSGAEATKGLSGAADEEWESFYGVTFPSLYAMIAREHMRLYGTTKEDLGLISIKNHENATLNPKAHFPKAITMNTYLNAPEVASPLNLMDCSPVSDGAAAIILSKNPTKYNVTLETSQVATSSLSLHDRKEITVIDAAVKAANKAYQALDLTPEKIDIAEVHDCFTIAEILAYEALGFAKIGKGVELIRKGITARTGKIPVNTSGGLKGCGHPVGATGIKQALEIVLQLSGKAGLRQIDRKLKYGLTHNVGGSGATCVVNVFKKNS